VGVGCVGLSKGKGRSDSTTLLLCSCFSFELLSSGVGFALHFSSSFFLFSLSRMMDFWFLFLHDTFSFLFVSFSFSFCNATTIGNDYDERNINNTEKSTASPSVASLHDKPNSRLHPRHFSRPLLLHPWFPFSASLFSSSNMSGSFIFFCCTLSSPFRCGFTFLAFLLFNVFGLDREGG
jgi:hypothetical protein